MALDKKHEEFETRISVIETELIEIRKMEAQLAHITDKLKKSRLL